MKIKTSPAQQLKRAREKLWEVCKQLVRKRDGDRCFICGKAGLVGSNWHTGHFIPSSVCGGYLRYDIRNLASSCYACNINLGGNGALFNQRLRSVYGDEHVERIFEDRQKTIKLDLIYLTELTNEYRLVMERDPTFLYHYTLAFRADKE